MHDKINKIIYNEHLKSLKNLKAKNDKKIIICFSGVPMSGKTIIAKELEKEFKGIRLSNDQIRAIIKKKIKCNEEDSQEILENYLLWLIEKLNSLENKLIILDSSIDRKYKKVKSAAKKDNYSLFVIRIKITKKTFKKKIADNKCREEYLESMNEWFRDYDNFTKVVKSDYVLDNNHEPKLNMLFKKIDDILK